jgi:glucose-1-phosphate adenylyltransferase
MDFTQMLETHLATNADVTIAAKPVDRSVASSLGIMRVDDSGRVVGFLEKPQTDTELNDMAMSPAWINSRGVDSHGRDCLANMGIYLFTRDTLAAVLEKTNYQDFGKEVFPASIRSRHVQLHLFDGSWDDIGTIASFYEANLQLAQMDPPFDLMSESSPIYSRPRFLPPSRVDGATIRRSLVADGCVIEQGTTIENSVVGLRCRIGRNVTIRNSVIMGADVYELAERSTRTHCSEIPPVGIGDGTLIEGALVDKNCRIGARVTIRGSRERQDGTLGEHCAIRDGIFIVPKDGVIPDDWTA